jgi:DNA polymerase-4
LVEVRPAADHPFPARLFYNRGVTDRWIVHIDLDAFFVAAELQRRPELRGLPVLVGGGKRGVVATASYEARKFGCRSAMPMSTALRLCPQAIVLPGDFALYGRLSKGFHAILRDCSPLVEPMGIDEAYLDLTGCEPLLGPIPEAVENIRARIRGELALTASAGLSTSRVVSKVASDFKKPDGFTYVPAGAEAEFLAPMPVRRLPMIGPKMEEALATLGMHTLGDLARFPVALLADRFGEIGPIAHDRALGIDPTPVGEGRGGAKSVSRETTFESDLRDRDYLHAVLRMQAGSVGADLRRAGRGAKAVVLKLRFADFETHTRNRTLDSPTNADQVLAATAIALLDTALEADSRPVRLIGVGAANLGEPAPQLSLLDPNRERYERLNPVLDDLRRRFGSAAVRTADRPDTRHSRD